MSCIERREDVIEGSNMDLIVLMIYIRVHMNI